MTFAQAALTSLLLALTLPCLLFTIQTRALSAVILFLVVLFVGLRVCDATRKILNDAKLQILQTLWLVKLALTFFLLYAGWLPQLDPEASSSWGYDPQRYFYDAYELIENGWNPLVGSNYQGIIFYYAAIFYIFGHNPIVPALINSFVTLSATIYLIRLSYEFKGMCETNSWRIAFLLLIPEVMWYDVITSREALVAALLLFSMLSAGRYIVRAVKVSRNSTILIAGGSLLGVLAVRTTMAFAIFGAISMMALLLRPSKDANNATKFLMLSLVLGLFAAGPWIQKAIGGYAINYSQLLQALQSFEDNVASKSEWSENSVGLLLSPNSLWQAVLFTPPRLILYLAAPLPNFSVSVYSLVDGSWSAWQHLMPVATSILNLCVFPYALAGGRLAWGRRQVQPGPMVIHIAFWMTLVVIAGGNVIIHERYRVMATLLLFTCAWFGYTSCGPAQIRRFGYAWAGFLLGSVFFFLVYKMLL